VPDITMCDGANCSVKNECYRYRAVPCEFRQAYFLNLPDKGKDCDHFWKIEQSDLLAKWIAYEKNDKDTSKEH